MPRAIDNYGSPFRSSGVVSASILFVFCDFESFPLLPCSCCAAFCSLLIPLNSTILSMFITVETTKAGRDREFGDKNGQCPERDTSQPSSCQVVAGKGALTASAVASGRSILFSQLLSENGNCYLANCCLHHQHDPPPVRPPWTVESSHEYPTVLVTSSGGFISSSSGTQKVPEV